MGKGRRGGAEGGRGAVESHCRGLIPSFLETAVPGGPAGRRLSGDTLAATPPGGGGGLLRWRGRRGGGEKRPVERQGHRQPMERCQCGEKAGVGSRRPQDWSPRRARTGATERKQVRRSSRFAADCHEKCVKIQS